MNGERARLEAALSTALGLIRKYETAHREAEALVASIRADLAALEAAEKPATPRGIPRLERKKSWWIPISAERVRIFEARAANLGKSAGQLATDLLVGPIGPDEPELQIRSA